MVIGQALACPASGRSKSPPGISTPEPNIGSRPKRTRMQQMPPVFFHSSDASAIVYPYSSTCAWVVPLLSTALWFGSIGGNTQADSHSHPPLPCKPGNDAPCNTRDTY
ncbi:hypothetical protein J3E69DRAFT_325146 [Trichoderma sp. SZMC 28015]